MSDLKISEQISLQVLNLSTRFFVSNKLIILIFHRVPDERDAYSFGEYDKSSFDKQMEVLSSYYNCISLEEGLSGLKYGNLKPLSICVTFDDGYADNYNNAAPILKRYSIPATIFVATGFLNGGVMWNDKVIEHVRNTAIDKFTYQPFNIVDHYLDDQLSRMNLIRLLINRIKYLTPDEREDVLLDILPEFSVSMDLGGIMMTEQQISDLINFNISVGAHTVSHPILKTLKDEASLKEIVDSRDYLESITGYRPVYFAYPNGIPGHDFMQRDIDNVKKAGFKASVSTSRGICTKRSDLFQLPRLASWGDSLIKFSARINKECIMAR